MSPSRLRPGLTEITLDLPRHLLVRKSMQRNSYPSGRHETLARVNRSIICELFLPVYFFRPCDPQDNGLTTSCTGLSRVPTFKTRYKA